MNTQKNTSPVQSDTSSDPDLVKLSLAGNDVAFALIMRRHNRLLFRSVRSILKNDDDTQDAVQEAYLRAWRALGSFRFDAKLSTWLVRIAVNEALALLRGAAAKVVPLNAAVDTDDGSQETTMPANPDEEPEFSAMRAQIRQQIEARIDTLPDQFRTVFMLRGIEGLEKNNQQKGLDPLVGKKSRVGIYGHWATLNQSLQDLGYTARSHASSTKFIQVVYTWVLSLCNFFRPDFLHCIQT